MRGDDPDRGPRGGNDSSPHEGCAVGMVPPMINRARGKTKEQRMRDRVRVKKSNKKALGHVPKAQRVSDDTPLTRRKGGVKLGAMSKKSIRKREKRARNVSTLPHRLPPRPIQMRYACAAPCTSQLAKADDADANTMEE